MEEAIKIIKQMKEEGLVIPSYGSYKYSIKREHCQGINGELYAVFKDDEKIGTVSTVFWSATVEGDPACKEIYRYFANSIVAKLALIEHEQEEADYRAGKTE